MNEDRNLKPLYLVASVCAALALSGMMFDIVLSMMPGWGAETAPTTAAGWLQQLSADPLLGLRNLDLLNVIISLVAIPMYVALAIAHRRESPAPATLGLFFVGIGTTLFAAANAALPMLELSSQWTHAGAPERVTLAAAAEGLLARGAHGSMGAFPGFFLSEVGTLAIAIAMLSGLLVSRRVAWLGVVGAALLAVYTVAMTFGNVPTSLVVATAAPGGILIIVWQVIVARQLWRRAQTAAAETHAPNSRAEVLPSQ